MGVLSFITTFIFPYIQYPVWPTGPAPPSPFWAFCLLQFLYLKLEERLTRKSTNTFFNRSIYFKFIHHIHDIYKCRNYKFREVSRFVLFLTTLSLSALFSELIFFSVTIVLQSDQSTQEVSQCQWS